MMNLSMNQPQAAAPPKKDKENTKPISGLPPKQTTVAAPGTFTQVTFNPVTFPSGTAK
jgi:hypothetical protein